MLELTLTGKQVSKEVGRVPMAEIPHHTAERYCSRLICRNNWLAAVVVSTQRRVHGAGAWPAPPSAAWKTKQPSRSTTNKSTLIPLVCRNWPPSSWAVSAEDPTGTTTCCSPMPPCKSWPPSSVPPCLLESPPLSLSERSLIHDGVDPLLNGLHNQLEDEDAWLNKQEQQERQRGGNGSLRLHYLQTFGYFQAVGKSKDGAVPENWNRRWTLENEECFITTGLKERLTRTS